MITHLALRNFRGFRDHTLPLGDLTLIVGANNAGKSTIVEALRLVSIVATRYRSLPFQAPPAWLPESEAARGVSFSLDGTGIDLATVMYQYEDPPASVRATFASGATVAVFLGPDDAVHALIRANDGSLVMDRAGAYRVDLDTVASQPQVAPMVRNEVLLVRDTIMLLDSDYHTPEQIAKRKADALAKHVDLHIWNRNELENYLLVPETITRLIAGRASRRTQAPSLDEVGEKILELADSFRDLVTDSYANEFLTDDRAGGLQKANLAARAIVAAAWGGDEGKVARCPGKQVLARLSEWSQAEFGVSFGATTIAAEIGPSEVPDEVRQVVKAVEERRPL